MPALPAPHKAVLQVSRGSHVWQADKAMLQKITWGPATTEECAHDCLALGLAIVTASLSLLMVY